MKKYGILIAFVALFVFTLNAQWKDSIPFMNLIPLRVVNQSQAVPAQKILTAKEALQRIQGEREQYYNEVMGLTKDEAEVFWPLYNQFSKKRNELIGSRKGILEKISSSVTEAEAELMTKNLLCLQAQESDLQKEYHIKFKAVISSKKLLLMYKAENDFKQSLLKHLQQSPKNE